jgi:hypothetical protein
MPFINFLNTPKNLLREFNTKVGGEDMFKSTVCNESLYYFINFNGVGLVNVVTSKILKGRMFLHRNIHNYNLTSPDWKTCNQIDHILIDRWKHLPIFSFRSFRVADSDIDNNSFVAKSTNGLTVNEQRSHIFSTEVLKSQELKQGRKFREISRWGLKEVCNFGRCEHWGGN